MPRYAYVCSECGFTKVFFHGINESVEICENCDQSTMEKDYYVSFVVNTAKEKPKNDLTECRYRVLRTEQYFDRHSILTIQA